MKNSAESRRRRQRRQAALGVAAFALLQLFCAACFFALCFIPELPGWAFGLFAALGSGCLLLIVPALVVLKQRFDEIKEGEYDAAAEY